MYLPWTAAGKASSLTFTQGEPRKAAFLTQGPWFAWCWEVWNTPFFIQMVTVGTQRLLPAPRVPPAPLSVWGKSQTALGTILDCFFQVLHLRCSNISPTLTVPQGFRSALRLPNKACSQHVWISSVSHALHTPVQSSLCAPGAEPHHISLSSASTDCRLYLNRTAMYREKTALRIQKNWENLIPPHLLEQKGLKKSLRAPAEKVWQQKNSILLLIQ